jgi:hypothetical protein
MKLLRKRSLAMLLGAAGLTMLQSCAVTGVGYDGTVGVGYYGGYYEPYGYDYGGWGPGYRVGPGWGGERRGGYRGGGGHSNNRPNYRPAPSSRPTPSIPNRPRGH